MRLIDLSAAVVTSKGNRTTRNQDNFYLNGAILKENDKEKFEFLIDSTEPFHIFAVCDGIGGENYGYKASYEAVRLLGSCYRQFNIKKDEDINTRINKINQYANETNDQIKALRASQFEDVKIGTTFTSLVFFEDKAITFNAGNSRVYLLRNGELRQLTIDNTEEEIFIQQDGGDEDIDGRKEYVLTSHLGVFEGEEDIKLGVSNVIDVKEGDIFMLCSDGLTDSMGLEDILSILNSNQKTDVLSDILVNEAKNKGGNDNITAMVVKINDIVVEIEQDLATTKYYKNKEKSKLILNRNKVKILAAVSLGICILASVSVFANRNIYNYISVAKIEELIKMKNGNVSISQSARDMYNKLCAKKEDDKKEVSISIKKEPANLVQKESIIIDANSNINNESKQTKPSAEVNNIAKEETKIKPLEENNIVESAQQKTDIIDKTLKYKILPGDNLIILAKKFYNDEDKYKLIMQQNNIKNSNSIKTGQTITIYSEKEWQEKQEASKVQKYKVLKGDTLTSISLKFYNDKGKYRKIMEKNNIKDINSIRIGQILNIPLI